MKNKILLLLFLLLLVSCASENSEEGYEIIPPEEYTCSQIGGVCVDGPDCPTGLLQVEGQQECPNQGQICCIRS